MSSSSSSSTAISTAIRKTVNGGGTLSSNNNNNNNNNNKPMMKGNNNNMKKKQQRGFVSSNFLFILMIGFILIWLGVYQYVFPNIMNNNTMNNNYNNIRLHNLHQKERIDDHHHLLNHNHDHEDLLSPLERRAIHKQLPPKAVNADTADTADVNADAADADADANAIIQIQQQHNNPNTNIHNNPYEGWQPKIHNDSDEYSDKCKSWRTCFKNKHDCPGKCRDGIDDFGIPPKVPITSTSGSGGFDQYGDDEDNKEKKMAAAASASAAGGRQKQWIPDVTVLRRMMIAGKDSDGNIWPPPLITLDNNELCEDIGVFGGNIDDHKLLLNNNGSKYIRGLPLVLKDDDDPRRLSSKKRRQPKILCMVYTMEQNHHTSIRAIRETWGGGCDGFLAFSTKDDPRIPAISLQHDGPEEYSNMVRYLRYTLLRYMLYVIKRCDAMRCDAT
jgi:hypothetical protein